MRHYASIIVKETTGIDIPQWSRTQFDSSYTPNIAPVTARSGNPWLHLLACKTILRL